MGQWSPVQHAAACALHAAPASGANSNKAAIKQTHAAKICERFVLGLLNFHRLAIYNNNSIRFLPAVRVLCFLASGYLALNSCIRRDRPFDLAGPLAHIVSANGWDDIFLPAFGAGIRGYSIAHPGPPNRQAQMGPWDDSAPALAPYRYRGRRQSRLPASQTLRCRSAHSHAW